MDQKQFESLNRKRQRLQGSLNYWKNAAHVLAQHATKATSGRKRESLLVKLAYCRQRATDAQTRLDEIKQQLTDLDPAGSIARQAHATRASRDKVKREIRQIENTLAQAGHDKQTAAYWTSRLETKRERLAVLEERLEQARTSKPDEPAPRHIASDDTLTILARIKTGNQEQPAANAPTPAALAPVIEGLRRAIALATIEGNGQLLEQLESSLDYYLEMEVKNPGGSDFGSQTPSDRGGETLQ